MSSHHSVKDGRVNAGLLGNVMMLLSLTGVAKKKHDYVSYHPRLSL